MGYQTITFLSDYGTDDEFVGVVKSVIRSICPEVAVIDLTHGIAPYDVRAGSLALARSVEYLAPGVVLAVVDPGVGTERRGVAVEVGEGQSVLVGPDNGLLAPAVAMCGGATAAVSLTNPAFQLASPGSTFDGRDVFAPAAAHLASGVALHELGEAIDPSSLFPAVMPLTRVEGDAIVAQVLRVDRYGNAQLNVDPDEVAHLGAHIEVRFRDERRVLRRITSFADAAPGDIGLLVDSSGLLALACDRASAALALDLHEGDGVSLAPGDAPASVGTPIELRSKPHAASDQEA
jgi:S-adenosylmethionine hydrolase